VQPLAPGEGAEIAVVVGDEHPLLPRYHRVERRIFGVQQSAVRVAGRLIAPLGDTDEHGREALVDP
jgi:hypothetical protein